MSTIPSSTSDPELNNLAINNFREYIRIPSVHPNVDYTQCIEFLKRQADSIGLEFTTYTYHPGKPIALLSALGTEPTLPSILLNSHMDVVPVFEDKWTHKPFDADVDEHGNIFGRGTQDMKSVGIQYLETVRRLLKHGITFKRTLHICFVPDEEVGGTLGMKLFVESEQFKKLNVGFALDEGLASPTDVFPVFYGERCIWQLLISCKGNAGHGSLLLENTAGEKVARILKKLYDFRDQEIQKLKENPKLTVGDVTTVNLTIMNGGLQTNVIPVEFTLSIDCRIPITVDVIKFEKTLHQWCKDAGEGVTLSFTRKQPQVAVTNLDSSNIYWVSFKAAMDEMKINIKPEIFTGGTDSRYIRQACIPSIGFSPMNNTPILLHDHDEYLNSKVFLRGIDIYYKLIPAVANS